MDEVARAIRARNAAYSEWAVARSDMTTALARHLYGFLPLGWEVLVGEGVGWHECLFWFSGPGGVTLDMSRFVSVSPLGEVLIDDRTIPEFLAEVVGGGGAGVFMVRSEVTEVTRGS